MHLVLLLHLKLCALRDARAQAGPEVQEVIESAIAHMETRLSRMGARERPSDVVGEI